MDPDHGFRMVEETTVHRGHVWHVSVAEFTAPDGSHFRRDIVRSPGAVGVLPLVFDAEGNASVVLVAQYRPPYDEIVIEIPAGMRDVDGEEPAEVAERELAEEAGLAAERLEPLIELYPSPGMTDSVTSIFLATRCTPTRTDRHGPEEEHMEILHVPMSDALAMVERGDIRDAKSVAALLLAARRLDGADTGGG